MKLTEKTPRPWKTFEHRCDRCGVESWFRFSKLMEDEDQTVHMLFLCGHHGNLHSAALELDGWFIENYTHGINKEPSVSANAV